MIFLFFPGLSISETITFDGPPNTLIGTNDYISQGVDSIKNGYYSEEGSEPVMQENDPDLPIKIDFVNLQSQVSIDILSHSGTILFEAFNENDQKLATVYIRSNGTNYKIIQNNIKYITLTRTGQSGFDSYDNLTFLTDLPAQLPPTITFDGTPNTLIGIDDYISQGVDSIKNGYYYKEGNEPVMQENDPDLPIKIDFVSLQSQALIDVLSHSGTILFEAFAENDQKLATVYIRSNGTNYTITQNDIKYITLTRTGQSGFDSYDNLTFQTGEMPVELTTFNAFLKNNIINLHWETATEINNYGFEIQREVSSLKAESGSWEKIGFVQGSGSSNSPKEYSFVDTNPFNGKVGYRLKQIDNDGAFKYSSVATVKSLPSKFELYQNFPNPFNPSTTIKYSVPASPNLPKGEALVQLKVYDILGNEVEILVNKMQQPGNYDVEFTTNVGTNNYSPLTSGVYFYQLKVDEFTSTKKMILVK